MELLELNKKIVNKQKIPFIIFNGGEVKVRDIYIDKICKLYNVKKPTYLEDFSNFLFTNNMLSSNNVYIIRKDTPSEEDKKFINALEDYKGNNSIIVYYTTLSKQSSFYKRFESNIITFNYLDDEILLNEIKPLISFNCLQDYIDLIHICQNDYSRILNEIHKINCYSKVSNMPPSIIFNNFIAKKIIALPENNDVQVFVQNVINRDFNATLSMLPNMVDKELIGVLSLMYANFRNLFLYVSFKGDKKSITKSTGLSYGLVKFLSTKRIMYDEYELKFILQFIFKIINNVKNGLIDNDIALFYTVINIL
jgi:hypothetical protein